MKQRRKTLAFITFGFLAVLVAGFLLPEDLVIPVQAASSNDWSHNSFWYEPWGTSGVHKGIDIFGVKGAPIIAPTGGVIIFAGTLAKGGNVIAVLGPKWHIHYFAHLELLLVSFGDWVAASEPIGTLGDSGNAVGKQPHVHYSILSLIPYPWLATTDSQGWKRMFYLDPHEKLG